MNEEQMKHLTVLVGPEKAKEIGALPWASILSLLTSLLGGVNWATLLQLILSLVATPPAPVVVVPK